MKPNRKILKLPMCNGTEEGMLALAALYPDTDGKLFVDEVVLNAHFSKRPIHEIVAELDLKEVHRKFGSGFDYIYVCPRCKTLFLDKKQHETVCGSGKL